MMQEFPKISCFQCRLSDGDGDSISGSNREPLPFKCTCKATFHARCFAERFPKRPIFDERVSFGA
jgi:hypothetical protein